MNIGYGFGSTLDDEPAGTNDVTATQMYEKPEEYLPQAEKDLEEFMVWFYTKGEKGVTFDRQVAYKKLQDNIKTHKAQINLKKTYGFEELGVRPKSLFFDEVVFHVTEHVANLKSSPEGWIDVALTVGEKTKLPWDVDNLRGFIHGEYITNQQNPFKDISGQLLLRRKGQIGSKLMPLGKFTTILHPKLSGHNYELFFIKAGANNPVPSFGEECETPQPIIRLDPLDNVPLINSVTVKRQNKLLQEFVQPEGTDPKEHGKFFVIPQGHVFYDVLNDPLLWNRWLSKYGWYRGMAVDLDPKKAVGGFEVSTASVIVPWAILLDLFLITTKQTWHAREIGSNAQLYLRLWRTDGTSDWHPVKDQPLHISLTLRLICGDLYLKMVDNLNKDICKQIQEYAQKMQPAPTA